MRAELTCYVGVLGRWRDYGTAVLTNTLVTGEPKQFHTDFDKAR